MKQTAPLHTTTHHRITGHVCRTAGQTKAGDDATRAPILTAHINAIDVAYKHYSPFLELLLPRGELLTCYGPR